MFFMDNEFSFRRLIWMIPEWVKRLFVGVVVAACAVACVVLFFMVRQADEGGTVPASLREKAAPYEEELTRIMNEMRAPVEAAKNPYEKGTVLMGFMTENRDDIPVIGTFQPILVTQLPLQKPGAVAWNGLWKNSTAVLDRSADTDIRREQLIERGTTVLFRQNIPAVTNASGKVTRKAVTFNPAYEDGITTLPFLLIDEDSYDMASQLNRMINSPSCLMLLFDVSKLSSDKLLRFVTQVQVSVDAGNLEFSTVADQEQFLMMYNASRRQLEADDAAYRKLQEERIRLLQEKIREIYRGGGEE